MEGSGSTGGDMGCLDERGVALRRHVQTHTHTHTRAR